MSGNLSARGYRGFSQLEAFQLVKVLFHTNPSGIVPKLQSLAACLGISAEGTNIRTVGSLTIAVKEAISPIEGGVVLDVGSLKNKCDEKELGALATYLSRQEIAVLLLVSDVDDAAARFLRILTNNAIRGMVSIGHASRLSFPANSTMLSKELSSHSFARKPTEASGLILSSAESAQVVMMIDKSPTFVRVNLGKTSVFVWVTNVVFDVLQPLAAEIEFEQVADEYIPAIIFLRFAFGERCWHNPRPGAGIVIDDPLLRKSYGFIKFPQLLESARRHKYHITLAFIPWNHWRSRAKEVQMFLKYSDCFSVCAHGCDHTKNEFRSTDYEELVGRNFLARQRMERHRERTGLESDPLMVCPQEQYSLEAMRAFADSRRFVALVCTACMPRNLNSPQITGADLLLPAQDSFYGFPVFKRHYWNGMGAFAMALFLGKPAILVEHHEFFRDGSAGTEEFVRQLAELRHDLKWKSLMQTITRTHARRRLSAGRWEVRFFTDTFEFEHGLEEPTKYRFLRRIPETTFINRVLVGAKEIPFVRENGFLIFEMNTDRPRTFPVQVEVAPVEPTKPYSSGVKYQACVALRRWLSELRDNTIVRNRFALSTAGLLTKSLRQRVR
jgi:hypothetical protein